MPSTATAAATPVRGAVCTLGARCTGRHTKRALDKHLLSNYDVPGPKQGPRKMRKMSLVLARKELAV